LFELSIHPAGNEALQGESHPSKIMNDNPQSLNDEIDKLRAERDEVYEANKNIAKERDSLHLQLNALEFEFARVKDSIKRCQGTLIIEGNDMFDWGWKTQADCNKEKTELWKALNAANTLIGETAEECKRINETLASERDGYKEMADSQFQTAEGLRAQLNQVRLVLHEVQPMAKGYLVDSELYGGRIVDGSVIGRIENAIAGITNVDPMEWAAQQAENKIKVLGPNIHPAAKRVLEELAIAIRSGLTYNVANDLMNNPSA
jgi:hypothetical protein